MTPQDSSPLDCSTLDHQLDAYRSTARRREQGERRATDRHGWTPFAAAAGASLAAASHADAAIQHVVPPSPIRVTLYDFPAGINLDGVGGNDLQINAGVYYATPTYDFRFLGTAQGLGGAALIGGAFAGPYGYAGVRRFNANDPIPAIAPATVGAILHVSATRYSQLFTYAGQFGINGTGFAGFVNDAGGSLHAGWIKIRTEPSGFGTLGAVSVLEWAYETVPGVSILAGQTVSTTPLLGDYNNNGSVGPEDYDTWKAAFGQTLPAGTGADGNSNGTVDAADYTVWRNNLGNTGGSGQLAAAGVPEPSAVSLGVLALGAAGVAALRRRPR